MLPAVTVDEDHAETFVEAEAADRVGTVLITDSVPGRVAAVLTALLLALESLLALRFVLLAFAANTASGFVDFVLDVSWPFVRPFNAAFADRTWDEGIVEVITLLAMGVWLLVFALVGLVLNAVLPNITSSETRVHRRRVSHM
jgi:hypothetical protein